MTTTELKQIRGAMGEAMTFYTTNRRFGLSAAMAARVIRLNAAISVVENEIATKPCDACGGLNGGHDPDCEVAQ